MGSLGLGSLIYIDSVMFGGASNSFIIIIIIIIITCYNFETVVCRGLLKLSLRVCPNSKTFDSIIIIVITMMIIILVIIASIIIIIIIRHFHISRRRAG